MSLRLSRNVGFLSIKWLGRNVRPRGSRAGLELSAEADTEDVVPGVSATKAGETLPPRPFSDVPGPKGYPVIGSLIDIVRTAGRGHLDLKEKFDKYGPIIKLKLGSMTLVHLKDVDAIEKLHRLEGKYPRRIAIEPWSRWREENEKAGGVLITDGPEWRRMRTLLDKRMMRPRHVATYTDEFNGVVTDFVTRLRKIRDEKGNDKAIPNLDLELFHWSLETIGTVLYEMRFGGLEEERDPEIAKFINAVHGIFRSTEKVIYFPKWMSRILIPKYHKMHEDAWDTIFTTGKRLIDGKMKEINDKMEKGVEGDGFLTSLILSQNMSEAEIYSNISELMLGAVDTTSNTMQWVLYELAEHPHVQHQLQQEVMSHTDNGRRIPNHDDLQKMTYLKAVIKEVLRLYPVAGVVTRVLNSDIDLCGYLIPKDSTVIASTFWTGRDPDLFHDPESFKPERWLRTDDSKTTHTFAWLPFGFGPRMCIGRRVAELEMHLLTARLAQQFEVLPAYSEPVLPMTRGLVVPERTVQVQLVDRQIDRQ